MEERKISRKKFWYNDNTVGYIFSLPFIIGFLAFTLIPIAVSMYYSVTDYKLGQTPAFIGIKNYLELLKDERFINSVKVTLIYVVTSRADKADLRAVCGVFADTGKARRDILPFPVLRTVLDRRKYRGSPCVEDHLFQKGPCQHDSGFFGTPKAVLAR